MNNVKPIINKLIFTYCNPTKGYDLMDIKTTLVELAKILEEKTIERIIEARLKERKRAISIAYSFMKDHKQSYEAKEKAGNDLAFIEDKIAEECRYIGNAISGINALGAALGESEEDHIRTEVRIDQLKNITGLDEQTVSKAIYTLKKGTLEEQLHWLKINL